MADCNIYRVALFKSVLFKVFTSSVYVRLSSIQIFHKALTDLLSNMVYVLNLNKLSLVLEMFMSEILDAGTLIWPSLKPILR